VYNSANKPAANGGNGNAASLARKITVPELRARKATLRGSGGAPRIAMVTAYDYTMARLVDESDADMVLVGDSLGMIVQGAANTLSVTLDEMVYHTRAVARGLRKAHLVSDMPFLTYQSSPEQALASAGRLVKEGMAESVKLEGGEDVCPQIELVVRAGIPVVGHIGLTPQSVHALGGFRVQGRSEAAIRKLQNDAQAIEDAGAFCLVLEAVPPDVAASITNSVDIPVIGIGAGVDCDGQVLVCTDLLGMSRGHSPKFAKAYAHLGDAAVAAMQAYCDEVRSAAFPTAEHSYKPSGVNLDRSDSSPLLRIIGGSG
jgi:3-methyl-2-oxobutanoate hydroxymethyltransferase